jgi:GT2 family glycosyltransferase
LPADIIPVSAVIATVERTPILKRTLESVMAQSVKPAELIVVDASEGDHEPEIAPCVASHSSVKLIYSKAKVKGAATQRMEGISLSGNDVIWFMDDDILLEPGCTSRLWAALNSSPAVGAVNAMITNQQYSSPGKVTSLMYRLMHGQALETYAGKVIGPAWNLLPEDGEGLSEYVACEWLNTGCTMYRKEAMPDPVFPTFFRGYAPLEDMALSTLIGKKHKLINVRKARIFHDSQAGAHKTNKVLIARMSLINRFYVMTKILGRSAPSDIMKLALLEIFMIVTSVRSKSQILALPKIILGKIQGVMRIASGKWQQ